MIRSTSILLALFVLEAQPAWATAKTPCGVKQLSEPVEKLHSKLTKTEHRANLELIATQASDRLKDVEHSAADHANRACLAYIAGSAYFVLSSRRADRKRYAIQAIHFFTTAHVLSPSTMMQPQPQSRLRTAWKRLGRLKTWPLSAKIRPLEIPMLPVGSSLRLGPPDPAVADEICGENVKCQTRVALVIEGTGEPVKLATLRAGPYTVTHITRCGARHGEPPVQVSETRLVIPPPPPCPLHIEIRDGTSASTKIRGLRFLSETGEAMTATELTTDAKFVDVHAVGYRPARLSIKAKQQTYQVNLSRCDVPVNVTPIPSDSVVGGHAIGPWGSRTIEVSRFGHQTERLSVNVPPPSDCHQPPPFEVAVALKRAVSVRALDANQKAVSASRLVVDGEPVGLLGFHLKPGQYTYAALHPTLGSTSGPLVITPCLKGACAPAVLTIQFRRASAGVTDGFWTGPNTTMMVGAAILLGGLASGYAASQANDDVVAYTTRRQEVDRIEDRIAQRDQLALTADIMALTGGVTILTGWLWGRSKDNVR